MADISLITLAETILEEGKEIDKIKYDQKTAHDILAQLSGYNSMEEILDIFAQKIIRNLMTSTVDDDGDEKRIVD